MGVSQGCLLSPIINYLIQYIHFHSSYVMTYLCVKFKENTCVGTSVTPPFHSCCALVKIQMFLTHSMKYTCYSPQKSKYPPYILVVFKIRIIRKICHCYKYPLIPKFHIVKLGYADHIFLIFASKHRLWVLGEAVLTCTHNVYCLKKKKKKKKKKISGEFFNFYS